MAFMVSCSDDDDDDDDDDDVPMHCTDETLYVSERQVIPDQ